MTVFLSLRLQQQRHGGGSKKVPLCIRITGPVEQRPPAHATHCLKNKNVLTEMYGDIGCRNIERKRGASPRLLGLENDEDERWKQNEINEALFFRVMDFSV
ncbi:hypothetical protein Tco_1066385 [Tanacetum coccineum]|uniref:Uncharacterized protein n=1 Tax=Tanacetum coccineum TaxID=301880 RepID=A0ABQ5HBZ0_9ASTR